MVNFFFGGSLGGQSGGGSGRLVAGCGGTAPAPPLPLARFPLGGDVFCQIILLYRFITAIKAKPSLTMHQIQGSSLKVHSEPVFAVGSLSLSIGDE